MATTLESLTELIEDTVNEREEARRELARAESQIETLRKKLAALDEEEASLKAMLNRRFPESVTSLDQPNLSGQFDLGIEPAEIMPKDWSQISRTSAVEIAVRILSAGNESGFTSPAEIEEFLRYKKRDDSRDNIGAALAHLNRTNRIHSVGRAQWTWGEDPEKA